MSDEGVHLAQWLRGQGQSDRNIAAHQKGLAMIREVVDRGTILPRHVDEALRREEAAGASGQRLANLKKIGDRLVEFSREHAFAPPLDPDPSGGGRALDVEMPAKKAATMAPERAGGAGPRDWRKFKSSTERCACESSELYLDDGADLMLKLAGGSGIFGFVVFYMVGVLGGIGTMAGLLAISLFASSVTVRYRCMTCRASCAPDDRDDAIALHAARLKYFVLAGIAGAISVGMWLWWWKVAQTAAPPPPDMDYYYYQ